ncbi:hypothetical protein Tco_0971332 [Tanacetum coccineum]
MLILQQIQQFHHNRSEESSFGPLYDEFFNDGASRVHKSSSPTDNSAPQDTHPTTNIQPTSEPSTPTNTHAEENTDDQAEFTNPFCTPVQEIAESSSRNIGNSNVHTFNQPRDSEYRWTKDTNNSSSWKSIQASANKTTTCNRSEMCMFAPHQSFAPLLALRRQDLCRICCTQSFSNLSDGRENAFLKCSIEGGGIMLHNRLDTYDPDLPDKVYRLRKALYGLKQAPRGRYDELSKFPDIQRPLKDPQEVKRDFHTLRGTIHSGTLVIVSQLDSKKQYCNFNESSAEADTGLSASCLKVMGSDHSFKIMASTTTKFPCNSDSQSPIKPPSHATPSALPVPITSNSVSISIKEQVKNGNK